MQLEDIRRLLGERFEMIEGLPSARSQTGECYVVIAAGSHLDPRHDAEGQPLALYPTEAMAIAALWESILHYAADKSGRLYWRRDPEVGKIEFPEDATIEDAEFRAICRMQPRFAATTRLLISPQPMIVNAA